MGLQEELRQLRQRVTLEHHGYWDGMIRGAQMGTIMMAGAHMLDDGHYVFSLWCWLLFGVMVLREWLEHRGII